MQDKRYQVFLSSTYEDLKVERRAVEEVIISMGDFPVGMEAFPAADEDQFDFIKSVIDRCDYYVLIVAGRYGSLAEDGISYTEKEYQYATSKGVPVLVLLHENIGDIPMSKSEGSSDGKEKLKLFVDEISKGRMRKTWDNVNGLKLAAREALEYAKATKPRVGWVRGDSVANVDALVDLHRLRKENEEFKASIGHLGTDIPLPEVPKPDAIITIDILPNRMKMGYSNVIRYGSTAKLQSTWISVFPLFYSNLSWQGSGWDNEEYFLVDQDKSCVGIGSALVSELLDDDCVECFKITKNTFDKLNNYYIESNRPIATAVHGP